MNSTGLLISQVGYDLHASMRAVYRGGLPDGVFFSLNDLGGATILDGSMQYWGNCWNSDWWVSDFSELKRPGEYTLTISSGGNSIASSSPFKVGEYLLWSETAIAIGIEQLEHRTELARFGNGWKECGADAREIGSHTALDGLDQLGLERVGPGVDNIDP